MSRDIEKLDELSKKEDLTDFSLHVVNLLESNDPTNLSHINHYFQEERIASFCTFDVFPILLTILRDVKHKENAIQIVDTLCKKGSAKEAYSMLMESIAREQNISVLKILIKNLQTVLCRIEKNRWKFESHAFPTILSVTQSIPIRLDPNADAENQELLLLEMKASNEKFIEILDTNINFIKSFTPKDDKEKDWILAFLFQLLSRIYVDAQLVDRNKERIHEIMKIIRENQNHFIYILNHIDRASEIKEEYFAHWDLSGVAVFLYLLFIQHVEEEHYEIGIYDNKFLYKKTLPYIQSMFQGHITFSLPILGKEFLKGVLSLLENGSLKEMDDAIQTSQLLINFMVSCPDDKQRQDAYKILDEYISKFDDEWRFKLLENLLTTCPFDSMISLLIHRLKEEIRLEFDAYIKKLKITTPEIPFNQIYVPMVKINEEDKKKLQLVAKESHFLNEKSIKLLLDILQKYATVENSDILLHSLNLYYYLLLRDGYPNITGIMNKENLKTFKEKVLNPILSASEEKLEDIEKIENLDLTEEELKELENLSDDEIEDDIDEEFQSTRLNIWMIKDVLERIQDLLK